MALQPNTAPSFPLSHSVSLLAPPRVVYVLAVDDVDVAYLRLLAAHYLLHHVLDHSFHGN
jgi:hypothetical protein